MELIDTRFQPQLEYKSIAINRQETINKIDLFTNIPVEICLHIFSYLGALDLYRIGNVNKAWRMITSDEILWKNIYIRKNCLTSLPEPLLITIREAGAKQLADIIWKRTPTIYCQEQTLLLKNEVFSFEYCDLKKFRFDFKIINHRTRETIIAEAKSLNIDPSLLLINIDLNPNTICLNQKFLALFNKKENGYAILILNIENGVRTVFEQPEHLRAKELCMNSTELFFTYKREGHNKAIGLKSLNLSSSKITSLIEIAYRDKSLNNDFYFHPISQVFCVSERKNGETHLIHFYDSKKPEEPPFFTVNINGTISHCTMTENLFICAIMETSSISIWDYKKEKNIRNITIKEGVGNYLQTHVACFQDRIVLYSNIYETNLYILNVTSDTYHSIKFREHLFAQNAQINKNANFYKSVPNKITLNAHQIIMNYYSESVRDRPVTIICEFSLLPHQCTVPSSFLNKIYMTKSKRRNLQLEKEQSKEKKIKKENTQAEFETKEKKFTWIEETFES